MRTTLKAAFGAVLLTGALTAQGAIIDFSGEAPGFKPNGYSPAGHPGVSFSDTLGEELFVFNFADSQSHGLGLSAQDDDASRLRIDFAFDVEALSLDFGNDDPLWADPGDRAWLQLFHGDTEVGLVSVAFNLDDVMNQTIAFSGAVFNAALFWYGNSFGAPINLIEIVDNIDYTPYTGGPVEVAEPGTFALLGLGLAGLGVVRRRRTG